MQPKRAQPSLREVHAQLSSDGKPLVLLLTHSPSGCNSNVADVTNRPTQEAGEKKKEKL